MASAVLEAAEDAPSECLADLDNPTKTALYIRLFELELLELVKQGLLACTVHTCVGQLGAVAERVSDGFAARRVGAGPVPLPSARHVEDSALPSPADLCAAIRQIS